MEIALSRDLFILRMLQEFVAAIFAQMDDRFGFVARPAL